MRPLWIFLVLFALSVAALFFLPGLPDIKGLLALIWAAFGISRCLWMAEFIFGGREPATDDRDAASLSQALQRNRGRALAREDAIKAAAPFTDKLALWLALAALYGFWMLVTAFFPAVPESYLSLARDMEAALRSAGIPAVSAAYTPVSAVLESLTPALLIAVAYCAAHSFSGSQRQGRLILAAALGGFAVSGLTLAVINGAADPLPGAALADHWLGYGFGALPVLQGMGILPDQVLSAFAYRACEIGMAGALYLYILGLYQAFVLLGGLGGKGRKRLNACLGLIVLLLMLLADMTLPADQRLAAFWLSGWTALAVLGVQSRSLGSKSARLYQR